MYSPIKTLDKQYLFETGEMIKALIKVSTSNSLDLAEAFGDIYIKLQNKVSTHDYTHADRSHYQTKEHYENSK